MFCAHIVQYFFANVMYVTRQQIFFLEIYESKTILSVPILELILLPVALCSHLMIIILKPFIY